MFKFQKTFSVFTPAEAERITGVSVALQRDWRRRNIIPRNDGHARFELFDLADILTLKLFSDAGLSLDRAKGWIPFVPATIIAFALYRPGAIEGDDEEYLALNRETFAVNIAITHSKAMCSGDLVIWPDGKSECVPDTDKAIKNASHEKLYGAVRILRLDAIGQEFARRAGRSLVHLEKMAT